MQICKNIVVVAAVTGILFPLAWAQESTKDLVDASLEDLSNMQVYSASRRMQNTSDAPSSVTIITAEEIQKFGYRTLADILRSVPGMYITYDRHLSFVGVRGFGRLGDWNNRVLVMVDGHRMNTNIFGQAMLGNEFPVDVDLIERVEIVLGPSSSLYGSNAFFGVINVVTRNPSVMKGWEVALASGSFESIGGRLTYGGNYKGVQLLLSNTAYTSEGQTFFFPEFNNPATNNGISRNADDEYYDHAIATIGYKGFTLQSVFSQREKRIPTGYLGNIFADPRTHNYDAHQYFDLAYRHTVAEKWQLELRTAFDQYRLNAPQAVGADDVNEFSNHGDWWTGEARLSHTFWQKHQVTFGLEVRDEIHKDQGQFFSADDSFEQDLNNGWDWGIYAQDDFSLTSKLSISVGIRHDQYPRGAFIDAVSGQPSVVTNFPSFGGSTNPRIGLIYHPYEKTTFKLLYGSAYRAPEVFETTPDVGSFVEDNPNLKPEKIRSYEVVAEQLAGEHFKLSGSIFYNDLNSLITLVPDPNSGGSVGIFENAERVHATGSEIQFVGRSSAGLQGKVSLSFVNADNRKTGQDLNNSPAQMAKINVSGPLLGKWLFGALEGQYLSPRKTLSGKTVGAYQVFNATLLGHTVGRHVDVSASVYNILNKKYLDPARGEEPVDTIPQDGRNFRIKITGHF